MDGEDHDGGNNEFRRTFDKWKRASFYFTVHNLMGLPMVKLGRKIVKSVDTV